MGYGGGGVASTAFAWRVCYDVAMDSLHVCTFLFDSRPADDAPEPQRLEPVGVEGREVDDRVRPDRYADERGAPPLVPDARRALLLALERLFDGGRCEGALLVNRDQGILRAERARAREAPLVAPRRGRLFFGREDVEAARVDAQDGFRRRAGRPRGPVCVFITFRTSTRGLVPGRHRGTQTKVSRARAPTVASSSSATAAGTAASRACSACGTRPELVGARRSRFTKRCMWATRFNCS